jgi:hypothetical protein
VEERDEGRDAGLEEVVDKLDIMVEARLVDGVVAAAEGDDARPREGEAVAVDAQLLEQRDVLAGAPVRVARSDARAAVGDLAGDFAEGVPDGRATAIGVDRTLDLVPVGGRSVGFVWPISSCGGSTHEAVAKPHRKSAGRDMVDGCLCVL